MQALVCVQETILAFQDGNWHVSLHPLPPFLKRYRPEDNMLHQLQTSSVAVVKDCFHAVDVACAEDFFEDPKWAVARFFNGRAVVRSLPPSACPRQTFLYYMNIVNISFISRQYAASQGMACVCVCAGVY